MAQGVAVSGLNPKGLLLFVALLPQFTDPRWRRNTITEAHTGYHTPVVQLHLRYGMILFIASEVMFFLAWFWAFFDSAIFPSAVDAVGGVWPPKGVEVLNPDHHVLTCSKGASVTLASASWP